MNKFEIGYMINPALNVDKVFREKVDKCLREIFHQNTMSIIINVQKQICALLH